MIKFLTLLLVVSVLLSCRKNAEITPISATENSNNALNFITPKNFPQAAFNFSENPLTKDKFQLGRHLFYDPIISLDSTISCATCHAQTHGFADHNIPFSVGIKGLIGTRNAPPVFNLAWTPNTFMWDGGVDHLEKFPVFPITNPLEMGEQMNHILIKLQRSTFYKKLFFNAYKDDVINEKRLFQSLAIYMSLIVSANSKYDDVKNGKSTFTENENQGYELFKTHCINCHTEPLFTNFSYKNNGLDLIPADKGRENITKNPEDRGKFKVPTLRNIDFTYPYMHDGRFSTLSEVLDHYISGIKNSSTTDKQLIGGINITPLQKKYLLSFLRTLNDFKLLGDTLVSEPSYKSLTENHK